MSVQVRPVLTEKALGMASTGKYTFWVPVNFSKDQIKVSLERIYGVNVTNVNTVKYKSVERRTLRRQKVTEPEKKKAIVILKEGQKIEVFSEGKKEK